MENSNQNEKWNRAISLITESVLKPDHDLRHYAHHEQCFDELMHVRETVLEYLHDLRK